MYFRTLGAVAAFFGKRVEQDFLISGFSVDTRTLKPGEVYCALIGNQVDGHLFVREAFEKGASGAIVGSCFKEEYLGPLIHVDDVLSALQEAARHVFAKGRPKVVIGVTGSLGKTTTKEFLTTLLEPSFSVFKTPGNNNSQVGLPLAILNGWNSVDIAVLEMGMTHPGQIAQLTSVTPPDIGLITKVSLVHAQNFESIQGIAEAKSEIFLHPQTHLGIYADEIDRIYNMSFRGLCPKRTFSLRNPAADYCLYKEDEWIFKAMHEKFSLGALPPFGAHNFHNVLGALAVAHAAGADPGMMREQVAKLQLPERRQQRVEKGGVIFINDSYNAALDSIKAAFHELPIPEPGGRRIGVLGGIVELGTFSEDCHRQVGEAALTCLDHLICFGEECPPLVAVWEKAGRPVDYLDDRGAIVARLRTLAKPGDVVLLKGSRNKKLWTVLDDFLVDSIS